MEWSQLFTDPVKMKVFFQQQLPGFSRGECLVRKCHVLRYRYHSDKNTESGKNDYFTARYELEVKDRSNGPDDKALLFAKFYPKAHNKEELPSLNPGHKMHSGIDPMVLDLPDFDTVVWRFPNDPGMSHLPEIINPSKVIKYLPTDMFPRGVNGSGEISDVKLEVVSYHPEVRCTFRLNLIRRTSKLSLPAPSLYGKTFNNESGNDLYTLIRHLWMMSLQNADSFIIAKPLAYHSKAKLLWQETLSGKPLRNIIDEGNCKDFLWSVAGGLAWIHKCKLSNIIRQGTFDQLDDILDKTDVVMQELPQFRDQLERIVSNINKIQPGLTTINDRPVHGSFRIKEVLVCNKGLAVFDLDKVTMGDWVRDLACSWLICISFTGIRIWSI